MDTNPFKDLRVAVTGGTSGLGLALVDALQRAGAKLAFIARDPHRVSAVTLRRPGTHGIAGDVSDKEAIHALALQVTGALGGLDILVNNASTLGPVPLVPLADTECEDFEAALATNVLGPFRLTKALLGALAASAREGRTAIVVNIASDAGVNAYANWGGARPGRHGHAHARCRVAARRSRFAQAPGASGRRTARAHRGNRARGGACMKAAQLPVQRPRGAKLLVVDGSGRIAHTDRSRLANLMRPGDVLVANDAATLPASLAGVHSRTGRPIEVRLAARRSLAVDDVRDFTAVLFGEGDHRTPTERRLLPPAVQAGDALMLGPLRATVQQLQGHPRLVALRVAGEPDAI